VTVLTRRPLFVEFAALGAAVATTFVVTACSASDATPPTRTVREAPTTTSSTTLEQSYAVPDVIDTAYVNRVLAALEHIAGDVVRKIHTTGQFAQEDLIPLRAIYNDPEFEIQAQGFALLVADDPSGRHEQPGDPLVEAVRIVRTQAACIYVEARVDLGRILRQSPPPRMVFLQLALTQASADAGDINPTPWSIADEDLKEEAKCLPS
jgi:hypothetical protein